MKDLIHKLDKAFDHRIRLGIMSALMVNKSMDFKGLKELLEVTDGNLASHLKALENSEYVEFTKSFVGRKPHTKYLATSKGKKAFRAHIATLEKILKSNQ